MRTIRTLVATLTLAALAAPAAGAQDLRSPDARDAAIAVDRPGAQAHDVRSPDARDAAATVDSPDAQAQDLRSPDARDAGRQSSPSRRIHVPHPPIWPVHPRPIGEPAALTRSGTGSGIDWFAIATPAALGLLVIASATGMKLRRRTRATT